MISDFRFKNLPPKTYHLKPTSGFTLVEMIVALGFFTIIMLIVISVLTSVAGANEKGRTMRIVIDNLNFAVENMARALRVGSRYHCGDTGTSLTNTQDCATGDSFIAFRNIQAGNVTTVFELDNGAVYRTNLDLDGGCASGDCTPLRLTAPEINVDSLMFYTKGSGEVDGAQAQILMITRGTAGKGPVQTDFDIQTTITQRLADS